MKIQEKMKAMMAEPPEPEPQEEAGETEEADFAAQAIAVLIKRGQAALMRGDVEVARVSLKAGLKIDMANPALKTLATQIKTAAANDFGS